VTLEIAVEHLSPQQASELLNEQACLLLDVREAMEVELAALPDSLHIPMAELPRQLDQIPRDATIVVMCHHGVRSAMAADFLERNGFSRVFNLDGGIDAWSCSVDEGIPRY
jgi:rhodanese-related sulfurtransferase